jgi:hypothetical protein
VTTGLACPTPPALSVLLGRWADAIRSIRTLTARPASSRADVACVRGRVAGGWDIAPHARPLLPVAGVPGHSRHVGKKALLLGGAGIEPGTIHTTDDHRLHAVRGQVLEMAGERGPARDSYVEAARHTTSLPLQRYLHAQAARLAEQ